MDGTVFMISCVRTLTTLALIFLREYVFVFVFVFVFNADPNAKDIMLENRYRRTVKGRDAN